MYFYSVLCNRIRHNCCCCFWLIIQIMLSWIWLPLTTIAHHPRTTSPIMHCTHTFPSTITPITQLSPITHLPWLPHHTCTSFTHSHISSTHTLTHCEVLFCSGWHSERFPCILPGLPTHSDRLLPALLTLPASWYLLCLLPAPTFALSLLLILPCLRYTPVAVYEPCLSDLLLSIIKAAIGSNYTASSLQMYSPANRVFSFSKCDGGGTILIMCTQCTLQLPKTNTFYMQCILGVIIIIWLKKMTILKLFYFLT